MLIRRLLLRILRSGNNTKSIRLCRGGRPAHRDDRDYAPPQFYVLTAMDDTVQFVTSVIVCSFTETVGAVWTVVPEEGLHYNLRR